MHLRTIVCILLAISAGGVTSSHAQGFSPVVGIAIGGGVLPRVFPRGCEYSFEGSVPSFALEARAAIPLGDVALESRTSIQGVVPTGGEDCYSLTPLHERGIHVGEQYPFRQGGITTTDLRLRSGWETRVPLAFSAGAGWVWGKKFPYAVISAGAYRGESLRVGISVDWMLFWVPIDHVAQEWENYRVVRFVSSERRHDLHSGGGLRISVEQAIW